jgi:hypothetical protein
MFNPKTSNLARLLSNTVASSSDSEEDGPTHQPTEQQAIITVVPPKLVQLPADYDKVEEIKYDEAVQERESLEQKEDEAASL